MTALFWALIVVANVFNAAGFIASRRGDHDVAQGRFVAALCITALSFAVLFAGAY